MSKLPALSKWLIYLGTAFAITLIACAGSVSPTPTLFLLPTLRPTIASLGVASATVATSTEANTPFPTIEPSPTYDKAFVSERANLEAQARMIKDQFDPTFGKLIEGKVASTDPEWQTDCASLLEQFDQNLNVLRELGSPNGYQSGTNALITALDTCSLGWRTIFAGAVNNDQSQYMSAIPIINDCNELWSQADSVMATEPLVPNTELSQPTSIPKPDISIQNTSGGCILISVCRDGTTSYSTGQGACSHHGGVASTTCK